MQEKYSYQGDLIYFSCCFVIKTGNREMFNKRKMQYI